MVSNSPRPVDKPRPRSGFALVIALSLMAFVLVLVLSISTLVQVETSSANISKQTLQARQNALLGAYIAVGNLQKYAGPDQRVTATGDILSDTDATKVKVVAVWDADPASPTYEEPLDWLVSRDPAATFDAATFQQTATSATDDIELVSERRSGAIDQVEAVRATPMEILGASGNAVGKFAWWVGDEGVKASLGLSLPDYTDLSAIETDLVETNLAYRYAIENLTDLGTVTDPEQWARVFDRSDSQVLDSSSLFQVALRDNFHDLTGRSFSVLANVKDGGLKKDLTAGLVSGVSLMEDDLGYDTIFPPQWGGSADEDPGGAEWNQLRDFYNFRVSGTGSGTVALKEGSNSEISVVPVITWGQVYVHAARASSAGDVARFYVMPAFALWNPYQHSLTMPASKVGAYLVNPRWKITDDIAAPTTAIARSSFPSPLVWDIPATTFAPGEVKLFSMDQHEELPTSGQPNLVETPLFDAGYGVFQDVVIRDETQLLVAGQYPQVAVTDDIHLAFDQSTGNAEFFLVPSGSGNTINNLRDNAFARALMLVLWSQDNDWKQIFGSSALVAPAIDRPLVAGTHGNPTPRIGYQFAAKFTSAFHDMSWINAPEESTHLAKYNVRSHFSSRSPSDRLSGGGTGGYNTNPLYTSGFQGGDALYAEAGNYATGYSSTITDNGLGAAGYFQLLREDIPVVSIGQFMHAELTHTTGFKDANNDPWIFTNYQPSFAIGNSLSDPRISNTESYRNWGDFFGYRTGTHYDQSYLLNDALWDKFYLSGMPRDGEAFAAGSDGDGVFDQDDIDEGAALRLPNPRLRIVGQPPILELAGNDGNPDLDSYSRSAEHLLNDGALNINSTSEGAWMALFSTFLDQNVRVASGNENNAGFSPLTRTIVPMEGPFTTTLDPTSNQAHSGYRRLTAGEAESLAASLVAQIRARVSDSGRPFLSMSEFVNRSLSSSNLPFRLQGVMQDAIDNSGINNSLTTGEKLTLTTVEGNALAFKNGNPTGIVPENIDADKMFGISAHLTAADIFAKFGHMLAPRSDTFVIRSYGAAADTISGRSSSEAYCEVIVQRFPETLDPMDNIQRPVGVFGRRFKIISIRWIDGSEV